MTMPSPTVPTQRTPPHRQPSTTFPDRPLADGFEIDDDPGRIDVSAVHRFLANEAYWALGRPLEVVERLVREADRVLGLYHEGRQVGFARVVTDGLAFAYLTDVYVLSEHQGRGLGAALVRAAVEEGPPRPALAAADAQGLYRRFGFGEASELLMERPHRPATARRRRLRQREAASSRSADRRWMASANRSCNRGTASTRVWKSRASSWIALIPVRQRTVAVRRGSPSSAISPKNSPGPSTAMTCSRGHPRG